MKNDKRRRQRIFFMNKVKSLLLQLAIILSAPKRQIKRRNPGQEAIFFFFEMTTKRNSTKERSMKFEFIENLSGWRTREYLYKWHWKNEITVMDELFDRALIFIKKIKRLDFALGMVWTFIPLGISIAWGSIM